MELSLKGSNWGNANLNAQSLSFGVNEKPSFVIPSAKISNVALLGKTDVSIEVKQDDTRGSNEESVAEIRLFIPTPADDKEGNAAQSFQESLKMLTDTMYQSVDAIVSFKELACLHPRSRFEVDMYNDYLRLHGKTNDYQIKYNNITSLFLLPNPDARFHYFVIGLGQPVRQGQTRYQHLVFQFDALEELTTSLNLSEKQLQQYNGELRTKYEDAPMFEVVSQVFKVLSGKKLIGPSSFSNHNNGAIKCNLKANYGMLYPLEKSLLFIPKPPTVIRYEDVSSIQFSRVGGSGSSKTFDLTINMKNGTEMTFSQMARQEFDGLHTFLQTKKVRIELDEQVNNFVESDGDDDDDDEDSDADAGRGAKKSRKAARAVKSGGDEDDDESDDDDFDPDAPSSEDEDGGEDDSSEEDSEDYESDASEEDEPKKKKKSNDSDEETKPKSKKRKASPSPASKSSKKTKTAPAAGMMGDTIDDDDED